MREIKFRAWSKPRKEMREITDDWFIGDIKQKGFVIMQYTGLKDRNGKEIYELMEINNSYRVVYLAPSYVLQDIVTGGILPMYDKDKFEVTGDYSPLP
jgi:hypothetical protein